MNRFLYRLKCWRIARSARIACRRADFVISAVREGMPVSVAVARSKSLFFPTID